MFLWARSLCVALSPRTHDNSLSGSCPPNPAGLSSPIASATSSAKLQDTDAACKSRLSAGAGAGRASKTASAGQERRNSERSEQPETHAS
eukprot:1781367-Alexandrium_andersonii.AAC.1